MIRVNLLRAKEPGPVPPVGPEAPSERQGAILFVLIMLVAVGIMGFQYFQATSTITKLDREISDLQQEKRRLQAIIQQVEEYEKKLQMLKEKEELIQRLKKEREGPVRMLDALSAELPDFVWLTKLSQTANTVTIDGMAASYVSIADYIRRLEDNELFQNVELIDARQDKEFTSFQLRSQLVTPAVAASAGAPAGSR